MLTVSPCLQIGWYNSVLPPSLHLAYPDDSLAILVLSTPSMFEHAFLPFMERRGFQGLSDPIDQCVKHCVSSAVSQVSEAHLVDQPFKWPGKYMSFYVSSSHKYISIQSIVYKLN